MRYAILQRLHHCSPQPPSIDPGWIGGEVAWDATVEHTILQRLHHCSPQATLHRSRVRSVARWNGGCNNRGTLYYKGSTIAAHRPPSIDPGLDQWQVEWGCNNRGVSARMALGKQWRLAMRHTQHWVGQRATNQHLSHVAAPPRQMRNQILDVNEALTFTIINSRHTKLSQHNRRIGGGATPTEIRGGYILAHSTDCTWSFAILKCLNYVACTRPPFWVMLE